MTGTGRADLTTGVTARWGDAPDAGDASAAEPVPGPAAPAPGAPVGEGDGEGNGATQSGGRRGAARHHRPTSRRARAAARRAGAGARARPGASSRGGATRPAWQASLARSWSRLVRPAAPVTPAGLARRRSRTMIAMALAAAAGVGLSLWGTSIMRGSTAGEYVEPSIRPHEPGYQAYVVATPTLAVLVPGDGGDLAAAALLSLHPGDAGGAVTVVPTSCLVVERDAGQPDPGDPASTEPTDAAGGTDATPVDGGAGPSGAVGGAREATIPDVAGRTVAEAYEDGGVDSAVEAMAEVLTVAVDEGVELDAEAWAALVEASGPIPVTLTDAVGPWPSGEVTLAPDQVGAFLAYEGPDEDEVERATRQAALWAAWLEQLPTSGASGLPDDAPGDLARFVGGIAQGASAQVLPVVASDAGGGTVEADPGPAGELISTAVPYPLSPAPGVRVRVRLLNGTDDPALTADVARRLVAAGAEVTVAGNAGSFDVTETTYTYDDPDAQADAQRFADVLGVGEVVEGEQVSVTTQPSGTATTLASIDDPEDEIDMTIVLGSDVRDLIRRLESTG